MKKLLILILLLLPVIAIGLLMNMTIRGSSKRTEIVNKIITLLKKPAVKGNAKLRAIIAALDKKLDKLDGTAAAEAQKKDAKLNREKLFNKFNNANKANDSDELFYTGMTLVARDLMKKQDLILFFQEMYNSARAQGNIDLFIKVGLRLKQLDALTVKTLEADVYQVELQKPTAKT